MYTLKTRLLSLLLCVFLLAGVLSPAVYATGLEEDISAEIVEETEPVTEETEEPEEPEEPQEPVPEETEEPVPEETEEPTEEVIEETEPEETEPEITEVPEEEDEEDTQMADSGTCGDSLTWTLDDDGTLTISGTGMMTNYYYSNSMDSSDAPWFDSEIPVKSVIIEDGVTSIGSNAFRSCENLTNVTIPDSVTSIGAYAFGYCWKLPRVTIGSGVTSIGENAFYNCIRLEVIDFLGDLPKIYDNAFHGVGADAFYPVGNKTYAKAGQYGGTINWLEGRSGPCGDNLKWTIDGSTLIISGTGSMFDYSVEQKEDGYLWVTSAPWSRLASVNTIRIENGVTSIGANAFYGCEFQTSISIPNSVKSIGTDAFRCAHLYGPDAYYFTTVNELYIDSLETWLNISFGNEYSNPSYGTEEETKVYVNGTPIHALNIPSGTVHIPDYAFVNWKGITSVTIPNGVKSIGSDAFACIHQYLGPWHEEKDYKDYSTKVEELYISSIESWLNISLADRYSNPISATDGETKVFVNGKLLQELTIPADQRTIPQYAFTNWDSIGSVTIPDSVTDIDFKAFSSCRSLRSVTIGSSVRNIGECAFQNCVSLEEIFFRGDKPEIAEDAFEGVTAAAYYPAGNKTYADAGNYGGNLTWEAYGERPDAFLISGPDTLRGGASADYKAGEYTSKQVVWTLRSQDASFAFISASGKLTTKAVAETVDIVITAYAKADPEASADYTVTLVPGAQSAVIEGAHFVNLTEGKEIQLTGRVLPASAMQEGSWKSSSNAVATVSASGLVEFKKAGTVTITFTASDGSKKAASVKLTAGEPVTGMTITGADTLASGSKATLKTTSAVKALEWSSSNPAAATVSKSGVVTAKTVYETTVVTITAETTDGSGVKAQHTITITPKPKDMAIWEVDQIVSGKTLYVDSDTKVVILDAMEGCTWSSSAAKVAEVNNGIVTIKKAGSATITAKSPDGKQSAKVTLKISKLVNTMTLTPNGATTLISGKGKVTIKAAVNSDAKTKTVTWSSSDPSVATVSGNGVVTAKAGVLKDTEVVITATAKDGSGMTAQVTVKVIPAATAVHVYSVNAAACADGMQLRAGETLNGRTITLPVNQSFSLGAKVFPNALGAHADQIVTWKSSSAKIAQVDENGVVTALKAGTVTITVKTVDGKTNTVKIKFV